MKASLVISKLQNLMAAHGDLEVGIQNAEFATAADFCTIMIEDSDHGTNRLGPGFS